MILFSALAIAVLLSFSAWLSALETAVTAASPGKIQKLRSEGSFKAIIALKLLKMKEDVISGLLVINSISNTVSTTLAAGLFISLYGDDIGTIISSSVMSVFIIVFAEVIPKAIAVTNAEKLTLGSAWIVEILMRILYPINYLLNIVVRLFCFFFGIDLSPEISGTEEIRGVIEHHHQEGHMFKNDRDMLGGILDISDMTISEIMVHRSNMQSIQATLPVEKIVEQALATNHTRLPVWLDNSDNIIGILHIRDVLKALHQHNFDYRQIKIQDFISEPWFVPDHALVSQQLNEFRRRRSHFALVVDEYGVLKGLVTLEDVLEEIVGQIDDEHDPQNKQITQYDATRYLIEGAISIRDLNREMNWVLPDGDASTIAGLIIQRLQRIPEQGESCVIQQIKLTVHSKENNRIKDVLAEVLADENI